MQFQINYGPNPKVAGVPFRSADEVWIREDPMTGIRRVYPQPDLNQIFECYQKSRTDVWPEKSTDAKTRGYREMVDLIDSHLRNSRGDKSVCDIGCYTGGLLKTFGDDWKKYGIEPSHSAAEVASKSGITIHEFDWREGLLGQEYDCVTLLSVIEHVVEQEELVRAVHGALKADGLFLVETGDFDSFWARFMGKHWFYYRLPEHVVFHSQKSLCKLLDQNGFEVVKVIGSKNHKNAMGIKGKGAALKRLTKALLKRLFSHGTVPWRALWLDHQWVLARKKS